VRNQALLFINGKEHRVAGAEAFDTLSNYLRYTLGQTGTKIVCEEGDCGACTVLVGRPDSSGKELAYRAVNSCIQIVGQLDGTSVVTVEGLAPPRELNAVQQAMVSCHGAQCGYCTPGFVVAMSALFETRDRLSEQEVRDGLTGNLCRCTGYEPIIKAALAVEGSQMTRARDLYPSAQLLATIGAHCHDSLIIEHGERTLAAPVTIEEAIAIRSEQGPVTILQGGTDLGVQANKRGMRPPLLISLNGIKGLDEVRIDEEMLSVGGTATLAALETAIRVHAGSAFSPAVDHLAELANILGIFGSPQIRNAGTLAGNIANGSPIADTLPFLFVMEARLELTGRSGTRVVPINAFYRGYKQLDLEPDEIITRILVPLPPSGSDETLGLYKVSRRKDLDISSFTAAIRLQTAGRTITAASVALGGVGPVVLRMPSVEALLQGNPITEDLFERAGQLARREINPISDVRGSRDFRLQLAENIFCKFYYERLEPTRETREV
jgi:xanthine dehydrogenase small subunit